MGNVLHTPPNGCCKVLRFGHGTARLANVIDTLRYADRLKEAGIETGQAEAMARALNAELTEGLAWAESQLPWVEKLRGGLPRQ